MFLYRYSVIIVVTPIGNTAAITSRTYLETLRYPRAFRFSLCFGYRASVYQLITYAELLGPKLEFTIGWELSERKYLWSLYARRLILLFTCASKTNLHLWLARICDFRLQQRLTLWQ